MVGKYCSRMLFALVGALLAFQSGAQVVTDEALLPEVRQILNPVKPDAQVLRQDVYVGQLTLNMPVDADYMDAGTRMVLDNYGRFEQGIREANFQLFAAFSFAVPLKSYYEGDGAWLQAYLNLNGEHYRFVCMHADSYGCAQDMFARREAFMGMMENENNVQLINRYLEIQQLPFYFGASYFRGMDWPSTDIFRIWEFRLEQAVDAIGEGHVDEGLEILAQEMAFVRRKLEQDPTLIGKSLAIRQLSKELMTISSLLAMPQVQPYLNDPRWQALLAPLSEAAQRSMAVAYENERNDIMYIYYALNAEPEVKSHPDDIGSLEEEIVRELLNNPEAFEEHYDRAAMVNGLYLMWQPIIDRAGMSMAEVSQLYVENRLEPLADSIAPIRLEHHLQAQSSGNTVGALIFGENFSILEEYMKRLYDVQNYMALVSVKYQMLNQEVDAQGVEAFLASLGHEGQDVLTQQPFAWDGEQQLLSTPWIYPGNVGRIGNGLARNTVHVGLHGN